MVANSIADICVPDTFSACAITADCASMALTMSTYWISYTLRIL
uniref:7TM_GPCR_Srx domain-containing protein n=1 Tax=Heterorhabditis bacteriophora TaxID=37862 RepID=A0A1I7XKD7_HETBA